MANALYDFFPGADHHSVCRRRRRHRLRRSFDPRAARCAARSSRTRASSASATTWRRAGASISMAATTARPIPASTHNNNFSVMMGLTYKFGQPEAAPPPPPARRPPLRRRSWCSSTGTVRISRRRRATISRRPSLSSSGSARVIATGHADKSGPDDYNMALSLRRANAVKNALVRERRAGDGHLGGRQGREPAAGADRRRRARAAEPPGRDRHPVIHRDRVSSPHVERPDESPAVLVGNWRRRSPIMGNGTQVDAMNGRETRRPMPGLGCVPRSCVWCRLQTGGA